MYYCACQKTTAQPTPLKIHLPLTHSANEVIVVVSCLYLLHTRRILRKRDGASTGEGNDCRVRGMPDHIDTSFSSVVTRPLYCCCFFV